MKRLLSPSFRMTLSASIMSFISGLLTAEEPVYRVAVNKMVDHRALDETVRGIESGLKEKGITQGKNLMFRIESAQANPALAAQISQKIAGQGVDVAVAVGTVPALTLAKYATAGKLKVVFSSVSFPVKSGIVPCLDQPGKMMTGVSNFVPLERQIAFFRKIQPNLKTLGLLYNVGESNSVQMADAVEEACKKQGIKLVRQTVTRTADVAQNAIRLAQVCDAIFISNDNTALSSLPSIVKAGNQRGIPIYVSDTDAVPLGALAALGPNQFDIGRQTGHQVAKILKTGRIDHMPIAFPDTVQVVINQEAAKTLSITFPQEVLSQAASQKDLERRS